MQVEDQSQKQHACRRVPEGVLALAALRRGGLKEVGHKPLHVVVIPQVHKGVVTMAAVHIQKVQHPDLIPFLLQ